MRELLLMAVVILVGLGLAAVYVEYVKQCRGGVDEHGEARRLMEEDDTPPALILGG